MVFDRYRVLRAGQREPDPPTYVDAWRDFRKSGITVGAPDAEVQLVEFVDFQCPACRQLHFEVAKLKEEIGPGLSVTYVHLPLDYHGSARQGAKGANCAHDQGALQQFVDSAFSGQSGLRSATEADWVGLAAGVGVSDTALFHQCLTDTASAVLVDAGIALATAHNVTFTPTVLLNGWRFTGALPRKAFFLKFVKEMRAGKHPPPSAAGSN